MDSKSDLIIKAITAIVVFLFLAKPLASLCQILKDSIVGNRNRNHDLDALISRQKAVLSQDLPKQTPSSTSTLEGRYGALYSQRPSDDVKHMVDLIRCLQWGEGGTGGIIHKMESDFFKQYKYKPSKKSLMDQIRFVLQGKYAKSVVERELPLFSIIQKTVNQLIVVLDGKAGWDIEKKHLQKGLDFLLEEKKTPVFRLMQNEKKFLTDWHLQSRIFSVLSPVPVVDSENEAYRIFGLNQKSSLAQLKSAYKKMAKKKHPDRLGGRLLKSHKKKSRGEFCQSTKGL